MKSYKVLVLYFNPVKYTYPNPICLLLKRRDKTPKIFFERSKSKSKSSTTTVFVMELAYLYTKKREEFGRHCAFKDVEGKILESVPSTDSFNGDYVQRRPMITKLDTTPSMSEHEVNTERLITKNSSMRHVEGGWPKDVDPTEQSDVQRFRKRAEKEDDFKVAVKSLGPIVSKCLQQNNTIDIYQDYFEQMGEPATTEQPSAKGLAVFRDQEVVKRTVSHIDWHPESSQKMAACYCNLNFQDPKFSGNARMPANSYIWDVMNPNTPDLTLKPSSPLVCMRYNPKSVDTLVGGSYNGLITFFDLRKSGRYNRVSYDRADFKYSKHTIFKI